MSDILGTVHVICIYINKYYFTRCIKIMHKFCWLLLLVQLQILCETEIDSCAYDVEEEVGDITGELYIIFGSIIQSLFKKLH